MRYFAELREASGRSAEIVETEAASPGELYRELAARLGAPLSRDHLLVAINDRMAGWDDPMADGDTVVFLTPFGGG